MQFGRTYTRTRAILIVFEKLTRAWFSQIALETIILPIQIDFYTFLSLRWLNTVFKKNGKFTI